MCFTKERTCGPPEQRGDQLARISTSLILGGWNDIYFQLAADLLPSGGRFEIPLCCKRCEK